MNPEMNITNVVILGGYGRVGYETAKLLIEQTRLKIHIAGRDLRKVKAACNKLNQIAKIKNQVSELRLNMSSSESLVCDLKNYDLLVTCIPVANIGDKIVIAAIKAGINYIDLNYEPKKNKSLVDCEKIIKRTGKVFISECGLIPGTPSFLVRLLKENIQEIKEIEISAYINEKDATFGSCFDLIKDLALKPKIIKNGKIGKASIWKSIKSDFGAQIGLKSCYPVKMNEIDRLTNSIELQECGTFVAGIDTFTDSIIFIWKILHLYKSKSLSKLGALLIYKFGNRNKPPYITLLKATGTGLYAGKEKKTIITISHKDGYIGTAIPVVATILQLIENNLKKSGSYTMGEFVDLTRFKKDILSMGMSLKFDNKI